jgi:enoyl-CoA hydratase/carnithine racemase
MFRLEQEGGIARLTLAREQARNAIPASGWAVLEARIVEIAASGAQLLILSGEGGAFCAGADLGDFAAMREDPPSRTRFRLDMRRALDALKDLEIPAIAWIEGPCYGAGVALAMACDLRLAHPSASFAITPAKIGISYPQQDIHRLVKLIGTGQASRLLFGALSLDAAEALRIGLVDLVELSPEPLAQAIAGNDPDSLKLLKRGLRLAAASRASDDHQDERFDALIGGEALARRLAELRGK